MSSPPRVEVEWVDAQGQTAWDDTDRHIEQAREIWDCPHLSVGYLIDETDDYVAVAGSWRPPTKFTAAQACDVIVIAKRNITGRKKLRT